MTTITFNRTGGVVGNDLDLTLELDTLPSHEAQRLMQLITKAGFFNLPTNLAGRASTDEFQYSLTVETEGASHTVQFTDTTMPSQLRMLVKELTMLNMIHQ